MRRTHVAAALVLLAAGFLTGRLSARTAAEPAAQVPSSPIRKLDGNVTHIGFVVRDIEKTAKIYADLFGVPMPQITENDLYDYFPASYSGRNVARVRNANITLGNLRIELCQPLNGPSPWRDFLHTHGEFINHFGFDVGDSDLSAVAAFLEKLGGKTLLDGRNSTATPGNRAPKQHIMFVDLTRQIGVSLELFANANASRASAR